MVNGKEKPDACDTWAEAPGSTIFALFGTADITPWSSSRSVCIPCGASRCTAHLEVQALRECDVDTIRKGGDHQSRAIAQVFVPVLEGGIANLNVALLVLMGKEPSRERECKSARVCVPVRAQSE